MASVKGSKHYPLKVVPHRPLYSVMLWAAGIILIGTVITGSYQLGKNLGQSSQKEVIDERDRLLAAIEKKDKKISQLRLKIANFKLSSDVDRKASEDARKQVVALKGTIATLKEDLSFYRGLMSPTDNKRGLTIGRLRLSPSGIPRHFEYKLVVQQLATNHKILQGALNFTVVGRLNNQLKSIPLKELSAQVDKKDIKLRFKYFQNIEGEMVLPQGFQPERIELLAKSTGRDATTVAKKMGWIVQES